MQTGALHLDEVLRQKEELASHVAYLEDQQLTIEDSGDLNNVLEKAEKTQQKATAKVVQLRLDLNVLQSKYDAVKRQKNELQVKNNELNSSLARVSKELKLTQAPQAQHSIVAQEAPLTRTSLSSLGSPSNGFQQNRPLALAAVDNGETVVDEAPTSPYEKLLQQHGLQGLSVATEPQRPSYELPEYQQKQSQGENIEYATEDYAASEYPDYGGLSHTSPGFGSTPQSNVVYSPSSSSSYEQQPLQSPGGTIRVPRSSPFQSKRTSSSSLDDTDSTRSSLDHGKQPNYARSTVSSRPKRLSYYTTQSGVSPHKQTLSALSDDWSDASGSGSTPRAQGGVRSARRSTSGIKKANGRTPRKSPFQSPRKILPTLEDEERGGAPVEGFW